MPYLNKATEVDGGSTNRQPQLMECNTFLITAHMVCWSYTGFLCTMGPEHYATNKKNLRCWFDGEHTRICIPTEYRHTNGRNLWHSSDKDIVENDKCHVKETEFLNGERQRGVSIIQTCGSTIHRMWTKSIPTTNRSTYRCGLHKVIPATAFEQLKPGGGFHLERDYSSIGIQPWDTTTIPFLPPTNRRSGVNYSVRRLGRANLTPSKLEPCFPLAQLPT